MTTEHLEIRCGAARTKVFMDVSTIEPGYPYERCNLWLLYTALASGVGMVRFI